MDRRKPDRMKNLWTYIKPYGFQLTFQFTIKFIGSIMDLFLPWLLAYIIDTVVPTGVVKSVYLYGGLMVACAFVALAFNIIANRMSTVVSRKITEKLRHDLFAKVSYLSAHQSDVITAPSLISRLTSDTYNVHQMVDRMQRLGVRAPILLLGGIVVTLTLEPVLSLVLISTLPILSIIIYFVSKKGIVLFTETQTANDQLVRKVQENMTGIRVIKALSKTDYEKDRFNDANLDLVRKDQKAGMLMSITSPTMNLLLNLGLTAVILVGAFRVNVGLTQPGQIIAFLSYFALILNALMMVTRLFTLYSKGAASANRIEAIMVLPEELAIAEPDTIESNYHLEFRDVSFSYNKIRPNLQHLNFALKPGETLGVIGETGSGKSTLISLLLRFYDCDEGEIRINGANINCIPSEILHTKFGVVFQNDLLYGDTIAENIDFGRSLGLEAIEKAAKMAQAGFIDEKEGGLSYRLAVKGANLSGGQKQRVLIARAMAANPEFLILDDSSSALDYITDAAVRKAIKRNFPETTTIIIAQRISSIMRLDKILMLEDGQAIGYGAHKELLATCPGYKEIFEAQMGSIIG